MRDIVWVVKHRSEVDSWYHTRGVFGQDPLYKDGDSKAYYESFVTNYVAKHADKFTGCHPKHIWHDLELYDFRPKETETDPNKEPYWESRVYSLQT